MPHHLARACLPLSPLVAQVRVYLDRSVPRPIVQQLEKLGAQIMRCAQWRRARLSPVACTAHGPFPRTEVVGVGAWVAG